MRARDTILGPALLAATLLGCAEREDTIGHAPWLPTGGSSDTADDGTDGEDIGSTGSGGSDTGEAPGTSGDGTGGPGDPDSTDTGAGDTTGDGGTTDGNDYTGPYPAERKLCVDLNNMFRAQMNVPVLDRYPEKEACVDQQAQEESLIDTPHGKLGSCGELRQNHGDGTGWGTLELIDWLIKDQFGEGPGGPHYEQMLDPNMTRIACGFYQNPNGNFWINIDFW